MDFNAAAIGGGLPPVSPPARSNPTGGGFALPPAGGGEALPSVPPPAVMADVSRAAQRYQELRAQGRELHFDVDINSGKVRVEVRTLDGQVIRQLPLSEALEVAGGAPLD